MKPDIKIISLFVVLFVCVYLAQEAEGGWRLRRAIRRVRVRLPRIRLPRIRLPRIRLPRFRIRLPEIREHLCRYVRPCRRTCKWTRVHYWKWACHMACRKVCPRGKREIAQQPADYGVNSPVPNQFADYDKNQDGFISLDEFAITLKVDAKEAKQVLDIIDQNMDGNIDVTEFNDKETNPLDEKQEGDPDVEATARALIERGLKEEDVEENLRNGVDSRSLFNHDDNKNGELHNLRSLIESIDDEEESSDDEGVDLRSFGEDEADDDVDEDTELVLEALARELKQQTAEDGE